MAAKAPETRDVIWPFDEAIKASGLLRARDYGNVILLCRRSQMRMPFLILALALFAIFVSLAIFAFFTALRESWTWPLAVTMSLPFIAVYLVFIHPYISSWRSERIIRSAGIAPATWIFSQQGIQVKDDKTDTNLKWSLATRAIVTKRYVLLGLGAGPYHTFGSPMFDSPAAWRNFRTGIIRNFVGCRGCQYDLHGTVSDTCPECGEAIPRPVAQDAGGCHSRSHVLTNASTAAHMCFGGVWGR